MLAVFALARAGDTFAVSTASSASLLAVGPAYLALAAGLSPTAAAFRVHLLLALLLLSAAGVAACTARQHEADWLRRLRAVRHSRQEERNADEILALMLPPAIVAKLKSGGNSDLRFANSFPLASVLFVEIVNFAALSALLDPTGSSPPFFPVLSFLLPSFHPSSHSTTPPFEQTDKPELVDMLNTVFSAFDALVEEHGAYKVEVRGHGLGDVRTGRRVRV